MQGQHSPALPDWTVSAHRTTAWTGGPATTGAAGVLPLCSRKVFLSWAHPSQLIGTLISPQSLKQASKSLPRPQEEHQLRHIKLKLWFTREPLALELDIKHISLETDKILASEQWTCWQKTPGHGSFWSLASTVKNAMSVKCNKEKHSPVKSICTAPFAFSPTNPTHLKWLQSAPLSLAPSMWVFHTFAIQSGSFVTVCILS